MHGLSIPPACKIPDVHTVKISQLDQLETHFQAWCIRI